MPLPDLIADAAQDPHLVRKLRTQPETVYQDYTLNPDEIQLLVTEDKRRISASIPPAGRKENEALANENRRAGKGSLLVAGSGITSIAHLTLEAVAAVKSADVVFYLVIDQLTINWIQMMNGNAHPLYHHYTPGIARRVAYRGMVDEIMAEVCRERNVTVLLYGHPGVLAYPGHLAMEQAREKGYFARMLPGVSADSCLIADLGIDPANNGMQAFEATQLLKEDIALNTSIPTILWQVGLVGDINYMANRYENSAFDQLFGKLRQLYGETHSCCVYEAAEFSALPPRLNWITFKEMKSNDLSPMCTLFVPPIAHQ
ncbi:Tetrapyrrole (Corrin/Porphyrin) Methylases [Pseudovibrio denitrificans]|uniref:Tetrapyrrole (Corrin/Porphyrin) Methylases n=1 Tax=Pseudovibrio denitrificans TaxID=258256 RepID=A0A1I7DYM4_9HYPH|nr:SAM-dependent methyltransferase [Pseudovibrio denitrificans]SFU16782.1 Tetrapyrrole (Corrin/Porphyrin) Methylases [Pseudovibrio denitrificans]